MRFILFSASRSGSSALAHVLSSSPDVRIAFEPFNEEYQLFGGEKDYHHMALSEIGLDRALEEIFQTYTAIKVVCSAFLDPDLNFYLLAKKDLKILFLRRRNNAQRVLSKLISDQLRVWHKWEDGYRDDLYARLQPIDLDTMARMMKHSERAMRSYERFLAAHRKNEYLPLWYEDLFSEEHSKNVATITRICDFLGIRLPPEEAIERYMNPAKMKINYRGIYRQVPNFQEIERRFGKVFD